MPTTTVTKSEWTDENDNEREQYTTTIPKGIAEALGLEGWKIEWDVESGNTLKVTKKEKKE